MILLLLLPHAVKVLILVIDNLKGVKEGGIGRRHINKGAPVQPHLASVVHAGGTYPTSVGHVGSKHSTSASQVDIHHPTSVDHDGALERI